MPPAPIASLDARYVTHGSESTDALFRVSYGEPIAGALHVPAQQFSASHLVEEWTGPREDLLFGSVSQEGDAPIEELSHDVYAQMIRRVREAGYPFFVRMWNYVGGINAFDKGRERYQLFCAGRHDAFVEAGYHHDVDLPAASAVGMRGRGLISYYLASREPGVQVENPRQVAAYQYPSQYGPKSPSFSRATVWRDLVFVSGTSSVIGHETVHRGDLDSQLDETLRNIDMVMGRAVPGGSLADIVAAKTYIRYASDFERIAERLRGVFSENLFVEADICRADLLLEIEGVGRVRR